LKGKVLKSMGKWYVVELEDGSLVDCRLRGKIRLEHKNTTNPIATGDFVLIDDDIDVENTKVITAIEKRNNYIVRKSTNLSKQMQVLAANIDHAYLLVTLKNPVTHLAFIDRFLVAIESFRIPTSILFNKIDTYSSQEKQILEELSHMYRKIGYNTHFIQANNSDSIHFLKQEIVDKQVFVSGHSGAGKSTLIKHLDASLDLKIGELSTAHKQGKHTTTVAQMHKLASGGYIIDTPGIKAFGIAEIEKEHIGHYFPEIRKRLNQCRYDNCRHLNEPNCAVKKALERAEIAQSRYESYCQLMLENPNEIYRLNKRKC